ncbi:MAG: tRNA uridine-5-carboxymethylaminomethyl(34) synthesis GTPase MnmE, partial [Proteobacteria bacterium]|nr:tRNA uridine-5-carboxymethylaminomethyl(34) synthesis GTPase MnmE [Pseudomonadota bacterium]
LPTDVPVTWVFNKIDVTGEPARLEAQATPPRVYLSATRGQGVDLLRTHLASQAGLADPEEGAFTARRRHLAALEQACIHVDAAASTLRGGEGFELFAEELRLAQQQLATITGVYGSEELLSDIFRSFCIGK